MNKSSLLHPFACIMLFISASLVLNNCSKTPEDKPPTAEPKPCATCLPPITTSGKGTFGCKVNGKVWLSEGGGGIAKTGLDYFDSELTFNAYNNTFKEAISISIKPISDTCYYTFEENQSLSSRGWFGNIDGTINFIAKPILKGNVHILHFDPYSKGIISGTFAFDAYNSEGDTVHITEGRFDLHF